MKTLRNLILITGALAISGCTAFKSFSEVEALNEAKAVGSPFTQALASEYREFANSQLKDMLDYPDALHFARKGLAAAAGDVVLPEPVSDWNLEEEGVAELSAARGRMILAFDLGAREIAPELSAKAQAAFDCWIEQEEEQYTDPEVASCKQKFTDAMADLEAQLPPPVAPEPEPEVVAPEPLFEVDQAEPMQAEDAMYLVFFDWDSSELGAGAMNVLDAVATEASRNPPGAINIIGHTDTSGATAYNQRLAFKRSNAVRDALISRGVDPRLLVIDAMGENELLVPTPDNVREPANRRVNISFN